MNVLSVMDVAAEKIRFLAEKTGISHPATDLIEARAAVAELIEERDRLLRILALPAHRHIEGAHLGGPVSGCVLCDAVASHQETRASLARVQGGAA